MGRFAFALTSFTAAVPAGILSTFLVLAFMKQLEGIRQSFLMLLIAGTTLGLSSFVVLIPFGILVFGGPKKKKVPVEKPAKKKEDAQPDAGESAVSVMTGDSEADILNTSGEAKLVDSDSAVDAAFDSSGEMDAEILEETTAFSAPLSSPDLDSSDVDVVIEDDLEDIVGMDEIEDEVILEDEDEDPKPKKKRR